MYEGISMKKIALGVGFAIAALLTVFPASVSAAGNSCDFMPEKPMPEWVSNTAWSRPGYYSGLGQAERRQSFEKQTDASRQRALENLAKKISVSVQSVMKDEMKSASKGSREQSEQVIELKTETKVTEMLRDVKDEGAWLDRANCVLYTLVSVEREAVEARSRFGAMMGLVDEVKKQERTMPKQTQLDLLADAAAILEGVNFTFLPGESGKEFYSAKLGKERERLSAEMKTNTERVLFTVVQLPEGFSKALSDKVVERVRSLSPGSDRLMGGCESLEGCFRSAKDLGFGWLAVLKLERNVEQSGMGGYKGTLKVQATMYTVQSKSPIHEPAAVSGQVISWEEEKLDWEAALDKIIKSGKLAFLGETNSKEANK